MEVLPVVTVPCDSAAASEAYRVVAYVYQRHRLRCAASLLLATKEENDCAHEGQNRNVHENDYQARGGSTSLLRGIGAHEDEQ